MRKRSTQQTAQVRVIGHRHKWAAFVAVRAGEEEVRVRWIHRPTDDSWRCDVHGASRDPICLHSFAASEAATYSLELK
ncbi:hypothetical protein EH165_09765 [Nakamurella antarctica]|uniref:Uncharacterized protein n=1 Tax=Nakamurella antarctica TaxID=1902245 RepID=A0A3G8ZMA6_9ACTN|nr:hypothetical protein [Nakamurella antarctica]AZI58383.1 hypothetical protein EH165_09765 [Nakamurella antarctica]